MINCRGGGGEDHNQTVQLDLLTLWGDNNWGGGSACHIFLFCLYRSLFAVDWNCVGHRGAILISSTQHVQFLVLV